MAKVGPQGVKGQEDKGHEKFEHWPLSCRVHSFTPHSPGGCTTSEREFSNCSCHPVGLSPTGLPPPPFSQSPLPQEFQSPHKCPWYLLGCSCGNSSFNTPRKRDCSWETCLHLTHAVFLLLHPSFPPFLSWLISDWLSAHNLVFGSVVPKIKQLQGKGETVGSEIGCWASKAITREPARFFSSRSPNSLQNARPFFSISTSTYLVPWIFSIPAPGSGVLGPESPSSKTVKGIMSLVKWRGTKICFAGRSEELPSVFTGPCEAEILLNQSQKRLFLLLNNNQKKKNQALYPSPHCPLITPTSSFPTLLLKEAFKLGFSTSTIFSLFSCHMVLLHFSTDFVEVWSWV